jgi:tetratricopeptide (TPR) repeat protein
LLNKLGVTELGLRHTDLAKGYLRLAIKKDKKDAEAWNNLGATEYMDGRLGAAAGAYRKALKLNPGSAVFHGNLATALVEQKDFEGARKELAKAMEIDPEFGTKRDGEAGISAHVLAPEDRARYCFEMARVYAAKGQVELMLHQLAMASENGLDLREKMGADALLRTYLADARVMLLIQNAKAMAAGKPSMEALSGTAGMLPSSHVK